MKVYISVIIEGGVDDSNSTLVETLGHFSLRVNCLFSMILHFIICLVNICRYGCAYACVCMCVVSRQEKPNLFSMFPSGPVGAFEWQINRAGLRLRLHQED